MDSLKICTSILVLSLMANVFLLGILALAPWMNEDYANEQIIKHLGGPEAYDSEHGMYVKDLFDQKYPNVGKPFWIPFGRMVMSFEGAWIVTFWGKVI